MKARSILFLFVGMFVSFGAVLSLMIALLPQPRRPAAAVASGRPPRQKVQPSRASAPGAPGKKRRAAPPPLLRERPASPEIPASELEKVDSASRQISRLIEQEKHEIKKQISRLEKDRDRMLAELAHELAALKPAEAAGQLLHVDDDTAARSLAQMSSAQRRAILQHFDARRAGRLNRSLRRHTAN